MTADANRSEKTQKSLFQKILGRSLISVLFGNFFEKKDNTSSIIALILIISVCYAVIFVDKMQHFEVLPYALFVVIGYYFGSKQHSTTETSE